MKKTLNLLIALIMGVGTALASEITVSSVTVPQGGTAQVAISLTNEDGTYTAGQMALVLPEGISAAMNDDAAPEVAIGERFTGTNHSFGSSLLSNGNVQFTIFSVDNSPIPNNQSELFFATLIADKSLSVGTILEGRLTGIEMTSVDGQKVLFGDCAFTITIGEAADNRILLDENSEVLPGISEEAVVIVKRTVVENKWSTIVLPFAMTNEQLKETFGNEFWLADFSSWSSEEDEDGNIGAITVGFSTVQSLEANHPYLLKSSQNVEEFLVEGVNVAPEDEPTVQVGTKKAERGYLIGSYSASPLPKDVLYLDDGRFVCSDGTQQMKGMRAWLELADVLAVPEEAAKRITLTIDGVVINMGSDSSYLLGDVNGDGQVGIGDIVAVTNVMAGDTTDTDTKARADVNGDTQVGIGDIVAITNIMAGVDK